MSDVIVERIIQSVCELDPTDYPEDDRDTLKTSVRDLRIILERHLAVPGEWTCDKCGFGLSTRTLHTVDGSVSVRSVMETPTCPNDWRPLRSMTWRELAESQREGVTALTQRLSAALDALHELIRPDSGQCNQCHGKWLYRFSGKVASWCYEDGEHYPHCVGRVAYGGR